MPACDVKVMRELPQPLRQIHLDYHTSEQITPLAGAFVSEEFGRTLKAARVASIQLFARCWHGWMYFPSSRFPEAIHPGLGSRDLLGEQIAACRERGIRAPIYLAVQIDRRQSDLHPEWVQRTPDSRLGKRKVFEPGLGPELCLNTPFADFLFAHVGEILERYEVDGLWFDGVLPQNCCCRWCLRSMAQAGLDAEDELARKNFGLAVVEKFQAQMSALVRAKTPAATLFYNSGHIGPRHRREVADFTHFELESLPGGGWGYLHFPAAARMARTFGRQIVGMTGKFHTSWGDFHSFKNPAALEFECFQMLALGAGCSVGDQLHPNGRLCPTTYELIGRVFEEVERVEPWCMEAKPVVEAALLSPESLHQMDWDHLLPEAVLGAVRLLQELAIQFDILETERETFDFSAYRLLILPDGVLLSEPLAQALRVHLQRGGKILSTGRSGLAADSDDFALKEWGVSLRGTKEPDYVWTTGPLGRDLPETAHVMYAGGIEVEPSPGTEILLERQEPFFDRTWRHFCSHGLAPGSGRNGGPAATRTGGVIHFCHPLFGIYREKAPRWCRTLVRNAIELLTGASLVRHNGPATILAGLMAQPAASRWVLHLLHFIPERRAVTIDIIEEGSVWRDLAITVRVPFRVRSVRLIPQNQALPFTCEGETLKLQLPWLDGRQMIALEFLNDSTPNP